MVAQERNEYTLVRKRLEVIFLFFLVAIGVLALRLTYVQWIQGRGFAEVADRMQGRRLELDAPRGDILDRDGMEMAQDVPAKAVSLNPRLVGDTAVTADRLSDLLGLHGRDRQALAERLERFKARRSAYCQLRRGVDRKVAEKILALSKTDPALKGTGIWLEDTPVRVNPGGADGLQLLGGVSSDGRGVEGLELYLERALQGKNGELRVRVSATGDPIPGSEIRMVEPEDGADVRLAIDRDIQHFVEAEVAKVGAEQNPDAATAIVMEVQTGHVLGMANFPSYKPKQKNITPAQRRNRAITDLFEPGSIFKVITAAAALNAGVDTNVYCGGRRSIGNQSFGCHGHSHGHTDLRKMVEQSCNIAAGTLSERVGPTKMYEYLDNMGFYDKTGIEFPGEEHGWPQKPSEWRAMRTANIGFGQGIVATPIQMVAAYAAIANDGMYNPPRLVLEAAGIALPERKPRRVLSVKNAKTLQSHMGAVVVSGTGRAAKVPGYSAAGKTGTAQIAKNGRYGNGYVASFYGFIPAS